MDSFVFKNKALDVTNIPIGVVANPYPWLSILIQLKGGGREVINSNPPTTIGR